MRTVLVFDPDITQSFAARAFNLHTQLSARHHRLWIWAGRGLKLRKMQTS